MSTDSSFNRPRSVVPRWRSFLNTPTVETVPSPNFNKHPPILKAQFEDLLTIWRMSGQPFDYVDIMDAGIASGNRTLANEGAKKIIQLEGQFRSRIVERANHVVDNKPQFISIARLPIDEESNSSISQKIARLKRSLVESPRNALSHVEIARLYSRLGQFSHAEHHLIAAISIAPNDRFVLRCITRFFTMIGEPNLALKRLWAAEALATDPWLQSAELSAASLAKRGTKFAHKSGKLLLREKRSARETSELTSGWITKLFEEGVPLKATMRSLSTILTDPTENALAQSVWLVDHMGREFTKSFPLANFSDDAHEARAMSLVEQGKYFEAELPMKKWFLDQPFQIRACESLCFLYFTHLGKYEDALKVAEHSLNVHPDGWNLLNTATISACMAGNYDRCRRHLKSFEKHSSNPEARSFILAAKGMLAFHEGRFVDGFGLYIESTNLSKKERSPRRIIYAFIYLAEMMVRHRLVDKEYSNNMFKLIEDAIKKIPVENHRGAMQILESRKNIIQNLIDDDNIVDLVELVSLSEFRNELLEKIE